MAEATSSADKPSSLRFNLSNVAICHLCNSIALSYLNINAFVMHSQQFILEVLMSTFGDRLNFLRKSKNLKAEELGEIVGLKRRIIFLYEKGETKPSYDSLLALADYFDVSLDYLVGRSDDPTRR
jgi:DNA-binding XRE family transcriptional regulator